MSVRRFPIRRSSRAMHTHLYRATVLAGLAACVFSVSESAAVAAATITVSATDCKRLVRHRPDPGVAYTPGVDVNGNPVAPADLPGAVTIQTPTEVTFDVTYDLLSGYGVGEDSVLAARGEASVGTVTYDLLSGALTFNGQRLDDAETAALSDLCKAAAQ